MQARIMVSTYACHFGRFCEHWMILVILNFNYRFGLAKSQALSDSSKAEQILVKCTGTK